MLKPSVFLSYKRDDPASAEAVARAEAALAANNLDVLIDRQIEPGDLWSHDLYGWLLTCSAAIAFVGEAAARSEWCRREWWFLRERHRTGGFPVIPVSVDGTWGSGGILDDLQGHRASNGLDEAALGQLRNLQAARPSAESYLAAHHAWLRYQYNNAPLWGREPFSLADVYVETECGRLSWGEITDEKKRRDPFRDDEDNGGRHDLVAAAMEAILDPKLREPIVVQGPPGSGKSAFTLRLANELLDRGLKPILVRFRDFRLTLDNAGELIEDALRIGPTEEEPPRPREPIVTPDLLDRPHETDKGRIAECVFILDGWDEVSLTGNASYQAQLRTWLPRLREFLVGRPGAPLRLVLTGRPSAEVRGSGILRKDTPIHTVRGMRPAALTRFARTLATHLGQGPTNADGESWSIDLERIAPILQRYESWHNEQRHKDDVSSGMDVLGSPLLAFLVFRTLADFEGDAATLVEQPTALYKALIDVTVAHAGKGQDEKVEGAVHRGGERLRFLLHRVACIITILGQEAVSFTELDYRLETDAAFRKWYTAGDDLLGAVNEQEHASALQELVVNFYFKGGNTALGCEFLHKSFREYLFAESVVAVLLEISAGKSGPLENPKQRYWEDFQDGTPQFVTSRSLSRLLAPQWLTLDIATHLFWLIEQAVEKEPERWVWLRDLLLDVYIWWAEGVHLRPQPKLARDSRQWLPAFVEELLLDALPFDSRAEAEPPRSAALDAHLGEALMEITALVHRLLAEHPAANKPEGGLRSRYRDQGEVPRFAPGGGGYFTNLVARINAAGWRPEGPYSVRSALAGVSLAREDLSRADLFRADLREADLSGANLTEASLFRADLRGADLRRASLNKADLIEVELSRANLHGASLNRADLFSSNLSGADLFRADLSGADLSKAILSEADLRGADLRGASLSGVFLSEADLSEADLSGADLRWADLSGASLSETDLSGVDCSTCLFLEQAQVNEALGDSETRLPAGIERPGAWSGPSDG